jgi:hypothetical protein
LVADFDDSDDVWTPEFISTIVVQLTDPDTQLSQHDRDTLHSLGACSLHIFHNTASSTRLLLPAHTFSIMVVST